MRQIDSLMNNAVENNVFPGAVLLAAKKGKIVYHKAFGFLDHLKTDRAEPDTVYDLASLTKVLATTAAVMHLAGRGLMGTDDRLGKLIPELCGSDKAGIKVKNLLCHNAGLPAWRPYYHELYPLAPEKRKTMLKMLLEKEPLLYPPGLKTLYSDVGFLLLQWAIENICGFGLDKCVQKFIYNPAGISDLFFLPLATGHSGKKLAGRKVAATGADKDNKPIRGQVNDENARAMGGVAGHAGLFGTAQGAFDLILQFIKAYDGSGDSTIFNHLIVRKFFSVPAGCNRALGFDKPEPRGSSSGKFFPRSTSLGHLGFTGTSFWMEPVAGIVVILLSNRVCPDPENKKITDFRPELHDTVLRCIGI